MRISKFVKVYPLGDAFAYYHSLKMKPVYLSEYEHCVLQNGGKLSSELIETLRENMIIVEDESHILNVVHRNLPQPYICLAYFILTEQCNLSCRYCFLGNGKDTDRQSRPMTKKIADDALRYFAFQTQQDSEQFNDEKEIIFYGGEPLLNFPVLQYFIDRSAYYIEKGLMTPKLKFSMVTNGLLLNEDNILFLKKHSVNTSVSIDGATQLDNCDRIDKNGVPIYERLIKKLNLVHQLGYNIGLSITLTESLLEHMDSLMEFLQSYELRSVCFNILHIAPGYHIGDEYYEKATDFIIKFYEKTKSIPIYEERFSRKLNTFINGGIYYSDCAATSGSQIVIAPSGSVGICHGCIEKHNYFFTDIRDYRDIRFDNNIQEWSKLSPVFQDECIKCEALGMCGGGCPINAANASYNNSIHSIDRSFCVHSRKILEYLIVKLYDNMKRNLIS